MTKSEEQVLCRAFGKLLKDIQHTFPIEGKILHDGHLSAYAHISTKTYVKVRGANIQTSPSI